MEEAEAIIIFKDLLVACKALADKNIAHRDIKPGKI